MDKPGVFVFPALERVITGTPAAEAVSAEVERLEGTKAFILASRTLNRETAVVEDLRRALGWRYVGSDDAIPATPRVTGSSSPPMRSAPPGPTSWLASAAARWPTPAKWSNCAWLIMSENSTTWSLCAG
jgi:hypothetical protein